MNPLNTPRLPAAALVGLVAALAACSIVPPAQDDTTRYFILSDLAASDVAMAHPEGALRIGLRPVVLEGYLKRRDMVVRSGNNEVAFEDYRLWAEPLDAAVGGALRSGLLAAPGVSQVYTDPFPLDRPRDFDVRIDLLRCEGAATGSGKYVASLTAAIEISTTGPNGHVVARKLFVAPPEEWDGADYGRLASLLSGDVAALGREVVADLPAKD